MRTNATSDSRNRLLLTTWAGLSAAFLVLTAPAFGNDYGRVSGTVADPQGNPVVGATVLITGPTLPGVGSLAPSVVRILSDASGKFSAGRLMPGYYSLRVTSPTRVPQTRSGVHVLPGETVLEKFVLSDIFASIRIQPPSTHSSILSDDWKWVLRTSASTRPVLRLRDDAQTISDEFKPPVPPAERLVGITPGLVGREAESPQPGMGAVAAYVKPLSRESDILVSAGVSAGGTQATSIATSIRSELTSDHPQEISLLVQQLSMGSEDAPTENSRSAQKAIQGRAIASKYQRSTRLSKTLVVTGGIEVDYLDALSSLGTARPHAVVEYSPGSLNTFTIRFGSLSAEGDHSLADRIALLNAFPQVVLRGNRLQWAAINHTEASFNHKLGPGSEFEIAAYSDGFENAVVRGLAGARTPAWLGGDVLHDPISNGLTVNAGNYNSDGFRALFRSNFGSHLQSAIVYTTGTALVAKAAEASDHSLPANLRQALAADHSESVTGKVTARLPASKTEIIASYQWMQRGRVTSLDPYELASLQLDPYLGIQIRQALPAMAFLPAHIEALADFQNLLAQGYVPVSRGGEQLILTPAYRSIRGGLSVEF